LKNKLSWIATAVFLVLVALDFFKNIYFYKEIAKAVVHSDGTNPVKLDFWSRLINQYHLFFLYGFLGIMLIGLVGILYLLKKKNYLTLMPLLVVLPSFLYLAVPMISEDNPWMLRRFGFSLIPCFIFYSAVFLKKWSERSRRFFKSFLLPVGIIIFLALNAIPVWKYFTFSEDQELLPQVKYLSDKFSNKDLILIDQKASGNGWAMITEPMSALYEKDAVYLVNPLDINRIDFNSFNRVFLISPNTQVAYYYNMLPNFSLSKYQDSNKNHRIVRGSKNIFSRNKKQHG
jgi:hypothetical protein